MRNYTILAAFLGSILLFSPALAAYEISDGSVVALYHLEDVADSSGGGYNLTNTGSVTFTSALLSNGADYGSPNTSKQLTNSSVDSSTLDDFSISFWYYITGHGSVGPAVLGYFLQSREFTVGYDGATPTVEICVGASGVSVHCLDTFEVDPDSWNHLVLIWDADTHTLSAYNNNDDKGSAVETDTSAPGDDGLFLGSRDSRVNLVSMEGKEDEVVVLNKKISPTEIGSLWASGVGVEVCVSVGCAGSGSTTPTSTLSTSTLTASESVLTYLFFMLDALWFIAVFLGVIYALNFIFPIFKK